MKNRISLFYFFFLIVNAAFSQSGQWAWIHGDTVANAPGHYGTKYISDPANRPPGLYEAYNWTDRKGNLWIYGGYNSISALCADMWKYNPYTNRWTWLQGDSTRNVVAVYGTQGVPSPLNTPGSRNTGVSWVDTSGNFWLYGGFINGLLFSADLWMFNPLTLEWTWMSGSQTTGNVGNLVLGVSSSVNFPPSLVESSTGWVDAQNQLWIYGGIYTNVCCPYDRVLKYSISTNEWTWVRGSFGSSTPTTWGTMGVSAATNNPGARSVYAHWEDSSGNFWFTNGYKYAEVWKYNPNINEWTWMGGSQTIFDMGSYGSYCDTASGNYPAHSEENKACYKDRNNQVWQFGGTTANSNDNLNDLWIFDFTSLKYKLMHGGNLVNQPAIFGQLGIPAAANIPHSCDGAILFGDSLCHTFLFGGLSRQPGQATYNAVWKFYPDSSCSKCIQNLPIPIASFSAPNQVCPGTCIDFSSSSINATTYQWFFPGALPASSTDVNPQGVCYNAPGSYDVTLIVSNANGSDTLLLTNYITVYPYPAPQGIAQSGDTLFANAGAITYQWYFNGNIVSGATDYFYVAPQSGDYNVVCTDSNACEVEAAIFDVVAEIQSAVGNKQLAVYPSPADQFLVISSDLAATATVISIFNIIGKKVLDISLTRLNTKNDYQINVEELVSGMYWIELTDRNNLFRAKFIKR